MWNCKVHTELFDSWQYYTDKANSHTHTLTLTLTCVHWGHMTWALHGLSSQSPELLCHYPVTFPAFSWLPHHGNVSGQTAPVQANLHITWSRCNTPSTPTVLLHIQYTYSPLWHKQLLLEKSSFLKWFIFNFIHVWVCALTLSIHCPTMNIRETKSNKFTRVWNDKTGFDKNTSSRWRKHFYMVLTMVYHI